LRRNGPEANLTSGRRNTRSKSRDRVRRAERGNPSLALHAMGGWDPMGSADSDADALASLGATSVQDFPAALRGHTRAEAVRALTLQIAGLEGSFHGLTPSVRPWTNRRLAKGARF
jgi:hypothetical protein